MTNEKQGRAEAGEQFQLLCTNRLNSVSSEHRNLNRKMLPASYEGLTLNQAKACLMEVLDDMPRTEIKEDNHELLKVEYRTMVFEFFHDAAFYFNEQSKKLQFHSGTRIGFIDFGSNKRWLQSVIARFLKKIQVYK